MQLFSADWVPAENATDKEIRTNPNVTLLRDIFDTQLDALFCNKSRVLFLLRILPIRRAASRRDVSGIENDERVYVLD